MPVPTAYFTHNCQYLQNPSSHGRADDS